MLFCTPKYLAASSTLISRVSPKRTGIRTPPYKLSGLLCPAGLWHLATTFVGLSHTQAVTAKPRNHDRPASDSGGSSAGDFCGAVNITGKFQSTAETAKLAAVYKLMLRGQCFLFSPKARKSTPKSLASPLIFDQSECPVKRSCNSPKPNLTEWDSSSIAVRQWGVSRQDKRRNGPSPKGMSLDINPF